MYTRELKRQKSKSVIKMDPDCAVCHLPADAACDCEAKGLDVAVKQAEDKVMRSIYSEIRLVLVHCTNQAEIADEPDRQWVRGRAQDFILEYFRLLTERRKEAHSADLDRIHSQAWYNYGMPPHPQAIADAQANLKRGIDEDWQASVHRYPEVLEYFFGLVDLSLPANDEPAVRNPPLGGLGGHDGHHAHHGHTPRKSRRNHEQPALTSAPYSSMLHGPPPRTPPPERYERRTPAPREREKRHARHSLPPQHAPYAPYSAGHGGHAPYMG